MSDLPATKQDLADAVRQLDEKFSSELTKTREEFSSELTKTREEFSSELTETREKFSKDLQETTDKLTEAIRDSQTEVLRAFYDWARPVDARLRHADELVQRMGWLEERVSKLERGKLPSTH